MSNETNNSSSDPTAKHTKRDAKFTPAEMDDPIPTPLTASPKSSLGLPSSGISIATQTTGTDTSLDYSGSGMSSTSTPPRTRSPSIDPKQLFKSMPADHPKVDLSNLPHWSHLTPEHAYERKDWGCPCPAIATLVNHKYVTPKKKHDRIPWYQMVAALRDCFNLDLWNALFLTLMATIMCGNWWGVSVKDLQRHNKVEHDASITRHDFNTGKQFREVSEDRLKAFMAMCKDEKKITLQDYALRRCQVESQLYLEGRRLFRFIKHSWIAFLGRGEVALTMRVFGGDDDQHEEHGMRVRKDWLTEWFRYERLPEDWKRREKPFNIKDTFDVGFALNERMNAIRAEDEQMAWCACPRSSQL